MTQHKAKRGRYPFCTRNCNAVQMPRVARAVFAGIPHHITQRGNRGEEVFFVEEDRLTYLRWLREYCQKCKVKVLAYSLMTNHLHVVMTPSTAGGLERVLKPLHMRYSQGVNRARGGKGHVWQGRFFPPRWMRPTCGRGFGPLRAWQR